MKASILSPGISFLSFDREYKSPLSHALHKYFADKVQDLGITHAITNGNAGPETMWAWGAEAGGAELVLFLTDKNHGDGWDVTQTEDLNKMKKAATTFMWISDTGWTLDKESTRIKRSVDMSDIVFYLKNNISAYSSGYAQRQIDDGLRQAKKLDKEIIIVKLSELL